MSDWYRHLSDTMKFVVFGTVVAFAVGATALAWVSVFGPLFADTQYHTFQHSQTHRGAIADDMAARCAELAATKDPTARRAIEGVIYARTSGIDINTLDLAPDVRACVTNARKDYLNNGHS